MQIRKNKAAILCALVVLCLAGTTASLHAQITDLASFNGTNGSDPGGGLILVGSTFYGAAFSGGASSDGVAFSVPVGGGTPTVLGSFNGTNGQNPAGGLTLSADRSTLYGSAQSGGVFSVPVGGGTPAILAPFNNNSNGIFPNGGLTLSGSTLYGTTFTGGANNDGVVFSVPVSGGTPTVLASFNGTDGAQPRAGLTLSADGSTLYGTASLGGAHNGGVVFSLPVSGGTPTVLASFDVTNNGAEPYGGLTLIGSTLYGTTTHNGPGVGGVVFSLPVSGGTPTVLGSFNTSNGRSPEGRLTLSADGSTLFGTTNLGGTYNDGVVFALPLGGGTPNDIASFNGTNGNGPYGDLTLSPDGTTLFGTTDTGGTNNDGVVFSVPAVPEPGSAGLLLAGFVVVTMRRRR